MDTEGTKRVHAGLKRATARCDGALKGPKEPPRSAKTADTAAKSEGAVHEAAPHSPPLRLSPSRRLPLKGTPLKKPRAPACASALWNMVMFYVDDSCYASENIENHWSVAQNEVKDMARVAKLFEGC